MLWLCQMSASLIGRLSHDRTPSRSGSQRHLSVGHASLRSRADLAGTLHARVGRNGSLALGALGSAADICGFSQTIVHAKDVSLNSVCALDTRTSNPLPHLSNVRHAMTWQSEHKARIAKFPAASRDAHTTQSQIRDRGERSMWMLLLLYDIRHTASTRSGHPCSQASRCSCATHSRLSFDRSSAPWIESHRIARSMIDRNLPPPRRRPSAPQRRLSRPIGRRSGGPPP
jgi:hypothetical protein